MLNVILQWLPLSIAGLVFIFAMVAWRKERQLRASYETKFAAIETVLKNSRQQNESLSKQLNELRAGTMGMSQKMMDLNRQLEVVSDRQIDLSMQDADGRLYSRASRMAELGADLHELMRECDLPKAEAELLMRLQQTRSQKRRS
ncbi:TPA: DUF2802 domain-containing protein [Photobacterium damselae]